MKVKAEKVRKGGKEGKRVRKWKEINAMNILEVNREWEGELMKA